MNFLGEILHGIWPQMVLCPIPLKGRQRLSRSCASFANNLQRDAAAPAFGSVPIEGDPFHLVSDGYRMVCNVVEQYLGRLWCTARMELVPHRFQLLLLLVSIPYGISEEMIVALRVRCEKAMPTVSIT